MIVRGRAERGDQLFIDDLDHLLPGVKRSRDLVSYRALAHAGNEIFYYRVIYIRFEQSQAHLAHGEIHILLRELPATAQFLKYIF
jgi:hypothetical protein